MQQKGVREIPSVRGFDVPLLGLGCRDPGTSTGEGPPGVEEVPLGDSWQGNGDLSPTPIGPAFCREHELFPEPS